MNIEGIRNRKFNYENWERAYVCIDLKSFYASVECVERGLDPMTTDLVVADPTRSDRTICLAVSPGLKSYGVPGRPPLFEVVQAVRMVNAARRSHRRRVCLLLPAKPLCSFHPGPHMHPAHTFPVSVR